MMTRTRRWTSWMMRLATGSRCGGGGGEHLFETRMACRRVATRARRSETAPESSSALATATTHTQRAISTAYTHAHLVAIANPSIPAETCRAHPQWLLCALGEECGCGDAGTRPLDAAPSLSARLPGSTRHHPRPADHAGTISRQCGARLWSGDDARGMSRPFRASVCATRAYLSWITCLLAGNLRSMGAIWKCLWLWLLLPIVLYDVSATNTIWLHLLCCRPPPQIPPLSEKPRRLSLCMVSSG